MKKKIVRMVVGSPALLVIFVVCGLSFLVVNWLHFTFHGRFVSFKTVREELGIGPIV